MEDPKTPSVFDQSYSVSVLPLIEVSGRPRERGRQYGEQAASRIHLGFGHYADQLRTIGLSQDGVRQAGAAFESTIMAFDPAYVEEMRGIAEGSGLDYSGILLLNARTEILKLARLGGLTKSSSDPADDPDGCTGVVVLPEQTAAGRLIHGLNWDWKAECADTAVVLKITRDDGPDILAFSEAGQLARAGFNSAGISVTGNYLECERDYRELGVPMPFIRRKILEQERFALAIHAGHTTKKSASINLMLAQAEGVAIDLECAPDETFLVQPDNGLIVHANHFQSVAALSKIIDKGIANMPDSLYRDMRVRTLIEPHLGKITTKTVKDALFDDFESPWSVCRPPRQSFNNNLSATVAMLVMEPAAGVMEVSMLPAINPTFQTFRLNDLQPEE